MLQQYTCISVCFFRRNHVLYTYRPLLHEKHGCISCRGSRPRALQHKMVAFHGIILCSVRSPRFYSTRRVSHTKKNHARISAALVGTHHVGVGVLPGLLQPAREVVKRVSARDVVYQQGPRRPAVVRPRDGAERLLPRLRWSARRGEIEPNKLIVPLCGRGEVFFWFGAKRRLLLFQPCRGGDSRGLGDVSSTYDFADNKKAPLPHHVFTSGKNVRLFLWPCLFS